MEHHKKISLDLKAEVLAAILIAQEEVASDQVAIVPVGRSRRPFAQEVKSIKNVNQNKGKTIYINKAGFYDRLPEGLFHEVPKNKLFTSKEEILAEIARHRSQEKNARDFFAPFEAELNLLRVNLALYENRIDNKTNYSDFADIFSSVWPEFKLLNNRQRFIWMHALRAIKSNRNNAHFLKGLLEHVFLIPVKINREKLVVQSDTSSCTHTKLGAAQLGFTSITGTPFFETEQVHITIGPLSAMDMELFLPEKKNQRILQMISTYLIPVFTSVRISLLPQQESRHIKLNDKMQPSYLGYTSYL